VSEKFCASRYNDTQVLISLLVFSIYIFFIVLQTEFTQTLLYMYRKERKRSSTRSHYTSVNTSIIFLSQKILNISSLLVVSLNRNFFARTVSSSKAFHNIHICAPARLSSLLFFCVSNIFSLMECVCFFLCKSTSGSMYIFFHSKDVW
jgi:hypothetical protein